MSKELFTSIRDHVVTHGTEIRHDDFITCWQYGMIQVCRKQDDCQFEFFILFGL